MLPVLITACIASNGDPSCPCIPTSSSIAAMSSNSSVCFNATLDSTGVCYPSTYGAEECAAHDQGLDPFCDGSNPDAYCAEPWCYVDAAMCHPSSIPYEASALANGMFFSYETCGGDPSAWRSKDEREALRGKVLKVAVPETNWPVQLSNHTHTRRHVSLLTCAFPCVGALPAR